MKTKREMPLSEALEEIASAVQRVKEDGSARVDGHEIKLADRVMLEIEEEAEKGEAEIEFEIKWPIAKGRKRRRLLFGVLAGAAVGAAALTVMRRRHAADAEPAV